MSLSPVETVAQAAVQTTSTVGRGFVPPSHQGFGDCRSVPGPGWDFIPIISWPPTAPVGSAPSSTYSESTRLFELPSSVWKPSPLFCRVFTYLHVSIHPSHWRYIWFALRSPAAELIVYQWKVLPIWLSYCPQSFYQTLGSSSSTLASAGMSDVSVHR